MMTIEFWLIVIGYVLIGILFMGLVDGYERTSEQNLIMVAGWPLILAFVIVVGFSCSIYRLGDFVGEKIRDFVDGW